MQISLSPVVASAPSERKPKAPTPKPPQHSDPAWKQVGAITDSRLDEVSGIATSQARQGIRWVHNDSGDSARVFAIDGAGALVQEVHVEGATAIDWEDMAVGPGRDGVSSVYVEDAGDNAFWRKTVQLYRFAEPAAGVTKVRGERIDLNYSDGRAHNVESMLVDPKSGDLVFVTKVPGGHSEIFTASKAAIDSGRATLQRAGAIELTGLATGGAVSMDGSRLAVRTYEALRVWDRLPGEDLASALLRPATTTIPAPGPQGEAITFTADGSAVITVSEGTGAPLYRHDL